MDGLNEKIVRYQQGEESVLPEIVQQMTPLVKKYANKIHFMEKEDAEQEFYLILIKSILKIGKDKSEGECIKYIEKAIVNRYNYLCRTNLKKEKDLSLDEVSEVIMDQRNHDYIQDIEFKSCIEKIKKKNKKKGLILWLVVYEGLTDAEIARNLGVSRQYVNIVKKELAKKFFKDCGN